MSKELYSWNFNSKNNRSALWYTIVLSIVIGLIIWWFFSTQYWLSFILLLLAWLYYFMENNSEDIIKVVIWELGINIVDSFYDYASIKSYTIVYDKDIPIFLRLNMSNRSWGLRHLDLNIDKNILINIKDILSNYLDENPDEKLSLSEKLIKLLKL